MKVQKYKIGDKVLIEIPPGKEFSNYNNFEFTVIAGATNEGEIVGVEILNDIENYYIKIATKEGYFLICVLESYITKLLSEEFSRRRKDYLCKYCRFYEDDDICKDCPIGDKNGLIDRDQIYLGDSVMFNRKRHVVFGEYRIHDIDVIDLAGGTIPGVNIKRRDEKRILSESTYNSSIVSEIYYLLRPFESSDRKFGLHQRRYYSFTNRRSISTIDRWKILQEPKRLTDVDISSLCKICLYEYSRSEECLDCKVMIMKNKKEGF